MPKQVVENWGDSGYSYLELFYKTPEEVAVDFPLKKLFGFLQWMINKNPSQAVVRKAFIKGVMTRLENSAFTEEEKQQFGSKGGSSYNFRVVL